MFLIVYVISNCGGFRWVRQLSSMGLPASVMAEAHDEAPRLVARRISMLQDWDWDKPEESLQLAVA